MIISEFIFAFKETWKEINKDKIRSKTQINEIKALMNEWKERIEDIKKVENILSKHWYYIPAVQRKDYIQKTYDLIHYGFNVEYHEDGSRTYRGSYDYGLTKMYNCIYNILHNNYTNLMSYYNKNNYLMVDKTYKNCLECVNEKLESYGITQKYKVNE